MIPRRTAADIDAWAQLVAQAERSIARPQISTVALERACAKARKAVLPAPPYIAANPFVRLLAVAMRFAGLPTVERADEAGALEAALASALALQRIETHPGATDLVDPPPRRFRADLDG